MRCASIDTVLQKSDSSSFVMPAANRTAPRWCRCNRWASSRSSGWLGSVATPSMINWRRATPIERVPRSSFSSTPMRVSSPRTAVESNGCPGG